MIFAPQFRHRKIILPRQAGNPSASSGDPDSSAISADSAHPPNNVFVARRKLTQARIINGWLILTFVLGAAIALVDGLTRDPNPWLELAPSQPLEYEPYRAAFLLAGVAFPLMFVYAKKARLSLAETLFLWFVFCTTAYMKDFSYLRLPGVPLFVTDVILLVLLALIYISPRRRGPRRPLVLDISLALFIAAGALAAARGFVAHRESILVLRDSALIGYSLFLLVGYHLLDSWLAVRRAAVWFLLGTALSVLNGLGWLIVAPQQGRFLAPGVYALISLVGVLVMMAKRRMRRHIGWFLAGIFSLGCLLANARSLFVCLVIAFLVALFAPGMLWRKLPFARPVTTLAGATLLACSLVFGFLHLQVGQDFTTHVAEHMASGILHTSDDPTWQFRLMAWKEAWTRFEQYPPAGEAFGTPFNFEIWDNDPRPHNTFLTVLYKMGLLGMLPFLVIVGCFFWFGLRAVHRNSANRRVHWLQILILAQVSFCVWGSADALLETPYLAALFWVGMGISLRVIQKLNYERALRTVQGGLLQ